MKYILFLLLISTGLSVNAQTPGLGYGDRKNYVMIYDSGAMKIKGDSLAVIKALLKMIDQDTEREVALLKFKDSVESFVGKLPLTKSQQTYFLQLVADFERKRYGPHGSLFRGR